MYRAQLKMELHCNSHT